MHVLIRCSSGDDSSLYVRKGAAKKAYLTAARSHFKKVTGARVLPVSGVIDMPSIDHLPSILHINNNLCPGIVCPLYGGRRVRLRGSLRKPLVVFIGESPGEQEERSLLPFCGSCGEVVDTLRFKAGFKEEDCTFINMLQCRTPDNREPTSIE